MGNVPYQEEIVGQVEGIVEDVKGIIDDKLLEIDEFVDKLEENMAYSVPLSTMEFVVPSLAVEAYGGVAPTAPSLIEFDPSFPGDFIPTDIDFPIQEFPTMDLNAPELPTRIAPIMQELTFTAPDPSVSGNVPMPSFPSFTMPTVPTLTPPTLRAFEAFSIPTFDGVMPEADLGTLQADFNYQDAGVHYSPVRIQLEEWLDVKLRNGGTGLGPDIEAAIMASFASRLNDEVLLPTYNQVMKGFASKGHTRPPGALSAAIQEVINGYNRKIIDQSRDIMVQQSKLAQEMQTYIINKTMEYEKVLADVHDATQKRILEGAKAAVQMAIEQQGAKIARYNAGLQAYQVQATVYESQIRAMMLLVEEYKAELEAGKIQLEMQGLYSQLYKDQLAGIQLLLDAYAKQLAGATTFIEVEKNKILLFQSQIEAFAARLGIDDRRLKLFTAQLDADKSVVQVWSEKMKGYGISVDAIKTQNAGYEARAALQNEIWNKTGMANYQLQLSRISEIVKNYETINTSRANIYESEAKAYAANVSAYAASSDASVKAYEAQANYAAKLIDKIIKEAEVNQAALNSEHAVKVESLKAVMNALTQLVASSLSAIHASMQIGYSGGYNANLAYHPDRAVTETHTFSDYCDDSCTGGGEA